MAEERRSRAPRRAGTQKVTIDVPVQLWEALGRMAIEDGSSRAEALRGCIRTEVWRRETVARGARLIVETDEGRTEVRFV